MYVHCKKSKTCKSRFRSHLSSLLRPGRIIPPGLRKQPFLEGCSVSLYVTYIDLYMLHILIIKCYMVGCLHMHGKNC